MAVGIYVAPSVSSDSTTATSAEVSSDGSEGVSASTTTTVEWGTVGMMILGIAVVGVAVRMVIVPERPGVRLGYA